MQIKCPYCDAKLNAGTPKQGRYKPKCKRCERPFLLRVEGDPPEIRVDKIDTATSASAPKIDTDATIDGTVLNSTPDSGSDATLDPASIQGPSASQTNSKNKSVVRAGNRNTGVQISGNSTMSPEAVSGSAIPERMGGYRIVREIGHGAMGAVYEAKQLSLDRTVALKTIRAKLLENAASLARFTREAYAAAQLTHHNVVQVYDFGEDSGRHFFSMEWVRGGSLREFVQSKGPLEPRLAVGYALQAARGLQFAHRNGMVHRDVKPANLLINEDGVVKVADLGLVKIADLMDPESESFSMDTISGMQSGTQVTMQGTAVGTPAYMAPEQGVDAATVDHRADIYSLGCSLFYMLAGKPPFDGSVVSEVLDQHARQAVPNLISINKRIPPQLQQIVARTMAKKPGDRYDSISDLIRDFETYLGVDSEGKFSPSTQQVDQWEVIAKKYASAAPQSKLAAPAVAIFLAIAGVLTLALPLAGFTWLLLGPAMGVTGIAVAVALGGRKSAVLSCLRRWFVTLSWIDYAIGAVGVVVGLIAVFAAGLSLGLFVGVLLGALAGAGFHFAITASSRKRRSGSLQVAEKFIRDLRINGTDEDGIRWFCARYAGKDWQAIYEALFGYDSLCEQRDALSRDRSFSGSVRSGIRDKWCSRLMAKTESNRAARDHKRLARIEERGLASQGLSAAEARDRAWQMASAIVQNSRSQQQPSEDEKAAAEAKRARFKAMMADARSGKYKTKRDPLALVKFALGGHTRLLAGCLLLVTFAFWALRTNMVAQVTSIANQESVDVLGSLNAVDEFLSAAPSLFGVSGISVGIAGLLLAMSSFVSGWRMTPVALVATIVIMFGAGFGIPNLGLPAWLIAAGIGILVYIPGIIWGETNEFE